MRPDELEPMSEGMRSLLDAERPLDAVPAAMRAKLFAKVSASVAAAGAGAGVATGAAAGGKTAAVVGAKVATGSAIATKAIIAAVAFSVGGGVGAGVHAVIADQKAAPAPAPIVIRMEAPPRPPEPEPELVKPEPEPAPAPAAPVPVPVPVKPATPKPADNLGAERSLIEQARAALSRHDAAAALSALQQHEREYGKGQLAEERLALQVLATSENGDIPKARELAGKFRARYPGSLLMPAVDAASPR